MTTNTPDSMTPEATDRGISFRERSAWIQFGAILLVYGLWALWLPLTGPLPEATAIAALIGTTVLIAIIVGVAHAFLTLRGRYEPADERDRAIALRSSRNAYWTLAVGVWLALWVMISTHAAFTATFYAVLGPFLLAELVRFASQGIYYRRCA